METMAMLFASAAPTAAAGATLGGTALAITGPELFLGSAAAATAAGGGVTAGSVLGGFGVSDILSGVYDGLSVLGDVLGTSSQIAQQNQLAADRELQALTVRNQATLDEIRALEELRARIGTQVANTFAGGLTTSGSPQVAIDDAIEQQEFETRVGGRDAEIRSLQLEAEADAARSSTDSILFSGLSTAGARLFSSSGRTRRRG